MTRRLQPARCEAGVTTVELLVAMGVMLIVLAGTLGTFTAFSGVSADNNALTKAEDDARSRVDQMVASLRNSAGVSTSTPVLRAGDTELVVNTDRPGFGQPSGTAGTARYCLDSSASGALWFSWVAAPDQVAPSTCPTPGWTNVAILNSGVANQAQGKPLFSFAPGAAPTLRAARLDLYLKTKGTRTTHLQSGVFFRSLAETTPTAPTQGSGEDEVDKDCGSDGSISIAIGTDAALDDSGNPLRLQILELDTSGNVVSELGTPRPGELVQVLPSNTPGRRVVVRLTSVLDRFTDTDVSCP